MRKGGLWRAYRTFIQGAISYLVVAVPALFDTDVSITRRVLMGVGMAAIMWGIAAVMNIKDPTTILEGNIVDSMLEQGGGEADDIPIDEEISEEETDIIEESAGEG